ncbi:MAG: recombinase family protein [Defluviitaleaceae bacterium]|nr:recombinase family protein [Defluviitaleaceae bacterium]
MARTRTRNTADNRQIAIYARKSKVTETGKSIEIQKEKCISLACVQFDLDRDSIATCDVADTKSSTNLDKADILVYEDEGKSGFYADRPLYKRMLKDIESNKIRAVICYKIDRISRRTVDLLNLIQQMDQRDIAFVSVSDKELDTSTRTGKIMISMLSAIAEFERDIIAERITDNMYELAKEGRWLGGKCPLGYYSKKEKLEIGGKKTTINHLEPVPDEQRAVRRIFEIFSHTNSLTGTATQINNEGFKTNKNNDFTNIAVKNILQNPVYAIADKDMQRYFTSFDVPIWAEDSAFNGVNGIMAYNKTEQYKDIDVDSTALDPQYTQRSLRREIKEWIVSVGKHKGLIAGAEWIKVQSAIAQIAADKSARPKEVSKALLSGLVRCVECGSRMFVRAETGRYNPDGSIRFGYRCDVKYRKKGGCENSPNIKGYELDNFVIEQICNMNTGANAFYEELLNTKNTLQLKLKEIATEELAIKKRLAQIEQDIQSQISNLRTAPEVIKPSIYADIEALTREQDIKQARLDAILEDELNQDSQIADVEKAKQTIMDFPMLVNLVDYTGKQQLLKRILECVIVKGDIAHIFLKGRSTDVNFRSGQERSDARHTELHSFINTPCSISSQPRTLIRLVRRNSLYKSNSTYRD